MIWKHINEYCIHYAYELNKVLYGSLLGQIEKTCNSFLSQVSRGGKEMDFGGRKHAWCCSPFQG